MPLQKPLRGFNKFLGLFTAGQLTFDIPPFIQPTVDSSEFLEPLVTDWSGVGVLSIGGSSFSLTVPENEQWRMRWMASTGGSAGRAGFWQHVIKKPVISNSFAIGPKNQFTIGGDETGAFSDLRGMTLEGGDRIGCRIIDTAGTGNLQIEFLVQYQKLAI